LENIIPRLEQGDSKSRDYRPEDYYKPEKISRFITGMKLK
jgi:hypothetical protein